MDNEEREKILNLIEVLNSTSLEFSLNMIYESYQNLNTIIEVVIYENFLFLMRGVF